MSATRTGPTTRVRVEIAGVVQGVGFRPTLVRLAARHAVGGFVYNDAGAVICEFEGAPDAVAALIADIQADPPPGALLASTTSTVVECLGDATFRILPSRMSCGARTIVPPDTATCTDCLRELRDPANRRYRHPFITCTNCGPRYTVITDLPYDRPATTMAEFPMCARCSSEYRNPADRRYHAQTIACPDCGPTLTWSGPGDPSDAVAAAAAALDAGLIVAVKGIGGYHLACRADDDGAVGRLRMRKLRPFKPFAVLVADIATARRIAYVSDAAAALLTSPAAPIVLLPARIGTISQRVAPNLADIGVMLAYTPIHHMLLDRLGHQPLVMTSANQGGSPIVFRECDLDWIDGLADGVLAHDRPVHVPCEDSVLTIDDTGQSVPIRRSRGYAPLPIAVAAADVASTVVLATGGDLKTTFCLMGADGQGHLSSHLGDMADVRTQKEFDGAYRHLASLAGRTPTVIAHDRHPDYATTRWAERQQLPLIAVQHHHAHAVALLAEHGRIGFPMLAVAFDGSGYGIDGSIWGGEFLSITTDHTQFTRVGQLSPFRLPGGDGAVRQPARIALDLLRNAGVPWDAGLPPVAALGPDSVRVLDQQLSRGIGCTQTTSMGRLFDAVASLLGICQLVTYEGQAAAELEHLARAGKPETLDFSIDGGVMDPAPVVAGIAVGLRAGVQRSDLAAGFHSAVIRATSKVAAELASLYGMSTIGLTGGVFVNRILLSGVSNKLRRMGFDVLVHRSLPCNDGGIALGQAAVAAGIISKGQ